MYEYSILWSWMYCTWEGCFTWLFSCLSIAVSVILHMWKNDSAILTAKQVSSDAYYKTLMEQLPTLEQLENSTQVESKQNKMIIRKMLRKFKTSGKNNLWLWYLFLPNFFSPFFFKKKNHFNYECLVFLT